MSIQKIQNIVSRLTRNIEMEQLEVMPDYGYIAACLQKIEALQAKAG